MKYCIIYKRKRDGKECRTRLASLPVTKKRKENFDESEMPMIVSKNDLNDNWFSSRS